MWLGSGIRLTPTGLAGGRAASPRRARRNALTRFLPSVVDHSPVATLLTADDGTIEYFSAPSTTLFGHTAKQLGGSSVFNLVHDSDRGRLTGWFRAIAANAPEFATDEFQFVGADGLSRRLAGRGASRQRVPAVRAIVSHWWSAAEITAHPASFALVENQFRVLIENALHLTAILDEQMRVRYISPAVERMLGYAAVGLIGHNVGRLVHPDDSTAVTRVLEHCARHPNIGRFVEFRAMHKDGSWRVLEAIATSRLDDPVIAGLVVDARDITERKWSAERLRRSLEALLAIHDVGRLLGSRLEQQEIGAALVAGATRIAPIEAAALMLRTNSSRLRLARATGRSDLILAARRARGARVARHEAVVSATAKFFALAPEQGADGPAEGCALPLRVHDRAVGVLEVCGRSTIESWPLDELAILADQAASALERVRLYEVLTEREHRLEQLVRQLLHSQEEERRRVAYEVHDGLAQLAAATQQHLAAFAAHYRSRRPERTADLQLALTLATQTVQEARRTIAGLRPTVLDDLGLAPAITFEVQNLRAEGWHVEYTDTLGKTRLEAVLETALFRVFQEAIANVRKHARTTHVAIGLQRRGRTVRLAVRDWGNGFQPTAVRRHEGPSERVGLAGMQERIGLLRGRCTIRSRPGAGTRITVDVPLGDASAETVR